MYNKILFSTILILTLLYISPRPIYSAVAYDAGSESHTGTSGSTNQNSFSWTHTPSGTPRGIVVFVFTNADTDNISTVTYGGITMSEISGAEAVDSAGEPGRTTTFFLGSSIPSGAQTIIVNRTNNATVMYAIAASVTADGNTEVYTTGTVLIQGDGTNAEQSVTDGSTGVNSIRFAAINSGLSGIIDNPGTPGANNLSRGTNSTVINSIDYGARVTMAVRETTAGQGSRSVGFSATTSDDRAAVHLAVREIPPITVSGNVYNSGTTDALTECDGATSNIALRVAGTTYTTTCNDSTGAFSFGTVSPPSTNDVMIMWIDGETRTGALVSDYTGSGNSTGHVFYNNQVYINPQTSQTIDNTDLDTYDSGNDADIPYTVTTNNLTLASSHTLRIASGKTYQPTGNVTVPELQITGTFTNDGTLQVNGTFTITSTGTFAQGTNRNMSVSGDFTIASGGTFTKDAGTGTLTFNGDLTYTDSNATKQNLGDLIIGTSPDTTDLASDLTADSITINAGDILNTHGYDLSIGTGGLTIVATGTLDATDDITSDTTQINIQGSWSNSGTFVADTSTVTFTGSANSTLNSGCATAGSCSSQTFNQLVINKNSSSNTVTLTSTHLTVSQTITVTQGIFIQGAYDTYISGSTSISVSADGEWRNISTGDLILGGSVSNSGSMVFHGSGNPCGDSDGISIYSTSTGVQRSWSGSGTFSFNDTTVQDMGGTASITVYSGTNVSGNDTNWTFNDTCLASGIVKQFTIAGWFYPTSSTTSRALMVKDGEIRLVTDSSNQPLCQFHNGVAWQTPTVSSTPLTTDTWQHVACTFYNNQLFIYINGQLTGSQSQTELADNNLSNWRFGSDEGSTYNDYSGRMDDIRIYNRTLSDQEIEQLYNYAPGPVLYYDFNENDGTTNIYDKSSNGNTGALGGSITQSNWQPGKFGSSFNFNGSNSTLIANNAPSLNLTGSFTLSSWIKPRSLPGAAEYFTIIAKTTDSADQVNYFLDLTNGSNVSCGFYNNPSFVEHNTTSDPVDINEWNYVTCTFDTVANTISIYVNGIQQYSASETTNLIGNSSNLQIGYLNSGPSQFFDGLIDDLKIYNYARTPAQIIEDMNGGHPAPGSPIGSTIGHWRFDETTNSTIHDYSINANNLSSSVNTTFTSKGKFGKALNLSGNNTYAYVADNSTLSVTGSLTLSSWVYPTELSTSTEYGIVSKFDNSAESYLLTLYGDEVRMYIGSANNYVTTNNANLLVNNWYHILGSYNHINQTIDIYVNGIKQLVTIAGTIPSSIPDTTSYFRLGVGKYIEPSTITKQISSDSDDAWSWGTDYYGSGYSGRHYFGNYDNNEVGGYRFTNINIDQGATIESAYLQIYSLGISAGSTPIYTTIIGNAVDNAGSFANTSGNRPHDLASTTATVNWTISTWNSGNWYDTSDISSIVQEIVNRSGWSSGNSLRFAVQNNSTPNYNEVELYDYSGSATYATKLIINLASTNIYFKGYIDEVKVYNQAFSQQQVNVDYAGGVAIQMGALSTESSGVIHSNSTERSFCVPGDTATCRSPLVYYPFDEGIGTLTYDKINGISGALINSPQWVKGRIGKAIDFYDTNRHVYIDTYGVFDSNEPFTLQAWIYPRGWGGASFGRIISMPNLSFGISSSMGNLVLYNGNNSTSAFSAINTINLNNWQHVVVTYNGSGQANLYVNGVDVTDDNTITESGNSYYLYIGSSNGLSDQFNGLIDEVKIYDYVRTPAQVAWDYNRGAPIAWYKFDECNGTNIFNSAPDPNNLIANTGTLTIGATGSQTTAGTCTTNGAWFNGATGKFNSAISFDGTDDIINLGSPSKFDNLPAMTISSWINLNSFGESNLGRIIDKDSAAASAGFSLFVDNNSFCSGGGNRLAFLIPWSTGPNGRGSWCSPANSISTGEWIHVAMSYNRSSTSNDPIFYINGNIVNVTENETPSGTVGNDSENNLYVGNRPETDRSFDGLIDDLRIYNYVLTPVQIKEIMNFGSVSFQ